MTERHLRLLQPLTDDERLEQARAELARLNAEMRESVLARSIAGTVPSDTIHNAIPTEVTDDPPGSPGAA